MNENDRTDDSHGVPPPGFRLPYETHVGTVHLQVSDLEKSIAYYQQVLGLRVLAQDLHGLAGREVGDQHVGRCTDDGEVAPEVGAVGQRPPEHVIVRAIPQVLGEVAHDRQHRRRVGDVVHDARRERREPQHEERPRNPRPAGRVDRELTHPVEDAGVLQAAHDDEQTDEEEERDPLHLAQRVVGVDARHQQQQPSDQSG